MKKHKLTAFALFFFIIHVTSGQDTLSLQEAIELGLSHAYGIKIAQNNQKISDNNHTRGNAGMLPRVNASVDQSYRIDNSYRKYETRVQEKDGDRSGRFNSNISLDWTIFDGLGMFITYEKLAEFQKIGEANLKLQVENTINDINVAYHQIVLEQERLKVIDNILDLSAERMEIARTKYEVGRASKMEFLAAQVDYNEDTSSYILQLERLNNARIDLNVTMGLDMKTNYHVQSSIEFTSGLQRDDLYDALMTGNSARKLQSLEYSIARLEEREIRAEKSPVISVNSFYNYNTTKAQTGLILNSRLNGWGAGISASWNIFNGFNLNRRIQNARINIENSEFAMEELDLALESQLDKAYNNYHNGIILHNLEKSNLEVARENAEIAFDRYKLGASNAIEFREAQLNLAQAENRLLDASYTVKLSEIRLMQLSGSLVGR